MVMPLDQLLAMWERLAERERKVFMTFGFRLLAGQKKYGPLAKGKKNWSYEAIEEALDASVYLTAMLQDKVDMAFESAVKAAEDEVEQAGINDTWPPGADCT